MKSNRLAKLNSFKKKVFRTEELQLIWEIGNKSTLYTLLNRYTKKKILFRVMRGVYSTVKADALDSYELACSVAGPYAYISTESVLFDSGVIMQSPQSITLVGLKSKVHIINGVRIMVRSLSAKFLHNRDGITQKDTYSIASCERAVADIFHYNMKYHLDNTKAVNISLSKNISKNVYNNDITIK